MGGSREMLSILGIGIPVDHSIWGSFMGTCYGKENIIRRTAIARTPSIDQIAKFRYETELRRLDQKTAIEQLLNWRQLYWDLEDGIAGWTKTWLFTGKIDPWKSSRNNTGLIWSCTHSGVKENKAIDDLILSLMLTNRNLQS